MFRVFGKRKGWLVAMTQEDGREAQMAAYRLFDEVLAFDGDEAGGGSAGAGEGGAEFLDARVLAAFNKAEAGTNGAGGHRGDSTPDPTGWGGPGGPPSFFGGGGGGGRKP